ncbi:hypothetical protein ABZ840_10675 [Streptomyces sp. NPDC047117]|uniref:hypothetical protein n=1 Tax=Streptomyces sp. NPDC047117 TaxID=3155379 RepID=UPI0034096144
MQAGRRRLTTIAGAAVGVLVLLAGVLYFTGTLQKWRDDSDLSSACKGAVDEDGVRAALGSGTVSVDDGTAPGEGALASCSMAARGGSASMEVEARWSSRNGGVATSLGRTSLATHTAEVTPLGSWPGVLTSEEGMARASVTLQCRNKDGEGLAVNARMARPGDTTEDSAARTAFARATVGIAEKAADVFGCDYRPAGAVPRLPAAPSTAPVALSAADGTCAAIEPLAASAEKRGLPRAWETEASGKAPIEDCVLASPDGKRPGYRLSAYYGSYARSFAEIPEVKSVLKDAEYRSKSAPPVAHAQCPNSPERALYTVSEIVSGGSSPVKNPSRAFETEALTAFAKQSAKQHGCVAPTTS